MGTSSGRGFARAARLMAAGIVLGAGVGGACFLYSWKAAPRYTASVPFRVLPPVAPIGLVEDSGSARGADDTGFVIRSQEYLFREDAFLGEILKDSEFRKDPQKTIDATATNQWLRENGANPKRLKNDLVVVPDKDAGMFELCMTAREPGEAQSMLQAAARVYAGYLKNEANADQVVRMTALRKGLEMEEQTYRLMSDALQVWASSRNIDVQRSKFDIEKDALRTLNTDWIRAQAQSDAAEAYYKSLMAMRKDVEINGGEIQLTPEMQQQLANDPMVRSLSALRMSLEQDKAAEESKKPANMERAGELVARMAKVDEQLQQVYGQLRQQAARQMEEQAKNKMIGDSTLASKVNEIRAKKEEIVRSLGQDLMGYEQRLADVRGQQTLLNDLRRQNNIAEVNRLNDNLRVRQMVETPVVPQEADVPDWKLYFPTWAGGGLLIGLLAAGLTGGRTKRPGDALGPAK